MSAASENNKKFEYHKVHMTIWSIHFKMPALLMLQPIMKLLILKEENFPFKKTRNLEDSYLCHRLKISIQFMA